PSDRPEWGSSRADASTRPWGARGRLRGQRRTTGRQDHLRFVAVPTRAAPEPAHGSQAAAAGGPRDRSPIGNAARARAWLPDGAADRNAATERALQSAKGDDIGCVLVLPNGRPSATAGTAVTYGRRPIRSSRQRARVLRSVAAQHLRLRGQRRHGSSV